MPPDAKSILRKQIGAKIRAIASDIRKSDSEKICALLKSQLFFQEAGSILFFAPLPREPDLWPLANETLAGKKMVALPCFDPENEIYHPRQVTDLHVEILSGKFGIREPVDTCMAVPPNDLDLVLVPGVAFGLDGHRLGRGKGYYDRLLRNFAGRKIGVAFDEQIVDAVPSEENDVRMDLILTPTRAISVNRP
ncbi:MAG TPA: 5-formyltetrahydrofolate cyclo-ligase [Verrucomicrobiae bacterium]|nr:5-formyltetrahydrofolate cyclo-ligase [Verrucomicrobiae bacterium]